MSWNRVKLSDVCQINIGKTPSRANPDYWGLGMPWLSIADMNQGLLLQETKEEITTKAIKESNIKIVPKGTVLFSFKLSIGKIGIAQRDLYTNEAIAALPIKDEKKIITEYLIYALSQIDASKTTDRAVMGATLNKAKLEDLEIPLPPLEEQKRIAAILDKADAIRRKRQQAIKLADDFLRAVFLEMFGDPVTNPKGWGTKSISEVAPFAPNRQIKVSDVSKVWLLNLDQVESNTGKVLSKLICEYQQVGNSTLWFDESHVLYCKLRPYLNKVVMPDSIGLATSELIPLKPKPDYLNREFLTMYLRSEGFVNWAMNKVAGAKMPRLSTAELREHQIILPPLDLQKKFASIFQKMRELSTKNKEALKTGNESFESLSHKMFS